LPGTVSARRERLPSGAARAMPLAEARAAGTPGDFIAEAASLRDRIIVILGALGYGLRPAADCIACQGSGARCQECDPGLADEAVVHAAIAAVQDAHTEAEALHAYRKCFLGLARARDEIWFRGL
jgi:hypothetical protein